MYSFDGTRSNLERAVHKALAESGIKTDPEQEDSFVLVVFRIDAVDDYRYILAHSGLREPEPMYVPKIRKEKDVLENTNRNLADPRGFRSREGIPMDDAAAKYYYYGKQTNPCGVLWISRRAEATFDDNSEKAICALDKAVKECFRRHGGHRRDPSITLYPNLWNQERLAIDNLRTRVRALGHFPPLSQVCEAVRGSTVESLARLARTARAMRVGVYLYTGELWENTGGTGEHKFIRSEVSATDRKGCRCYDYLTCSDVSNSEHAFDWVHRSGKPVLITTPLSSTWKKRLSECISVPSEGGLCIAPIRYDRDDAHVIGLFAVSIEKPGPLSPAYCFLATRIAQSIVGYLTRLFPAPGFPWWPDAKVEKGKSSVTFAQPQEDAPAARRKDWSPEFRRNIEHVAQSIMPDRSTVQLTQLTPGLTGSAVFSMVISDEKKLVEIPRVLKVGKAQVIGDELYRYYRYVHNKPVGGHSRVDVAMCFPDRPWIPQIEAEKSELRDDGKSSTAAIAYTLVGSGSNPIRWNTWAKTASKRNIEKGIKIAMQHLACWHLRAAEARGTLGQMLAISSTMSKQEDRSLYNDDIKKTLELLKVIMGLSGSSRRGSRSCVVHGDLHCDNVFTLAGDSGELLDIAIIDWGKVESEKHPSTDLAILVGDLVFRVCPKKSIDVNWALCMLAKYGKEFAYDDNESKIVFCFHLLRMLGWGPMEGRSPWIEGSKRRSKVLSSVEKILGSLQ